MSTPNVIKQSVSVNASAPVSGYPAIALSIRQPWAWLIIHAGKNIENRNWPTRFRGRVAIHASKGMTMREYDEALNWVVLNVRLPLDFHEPHMDELQRGGLIGEAEIIDCVTASPSPWFVGEYGFVLRNAKPLPFVPVKGSLGFFRPGNAKLRQDAPANQRREFPSDHRTT